MLEWWYGDRNDAWNVKPRVDVLCVNAGADKGDVWEPDAGGASKHCEVSQVLVGLDREQSEGEMQDTPGTNECLCELYPKFRHSHFLSFCATQVIFITEYMSSGSLKQFWRRQRKTTKLWMWRWGVLSIIQIEKTVCRKVREQCHLLAEIWQNHNTGTIYMSQAWKRWCTQILSALR